MNADRWIIDWEPSQRFPVYTRANAGEVLPHPVSPLCATMLWEPGFAMGWRDAMTSVGTLNDDEIAPSRPEVIGFFGGHLYINASVARLFGVRAPGLSPEMIDYVYFGEHADVPPYEHEAWHDSEANTAQLGEWMQRYLVADDLPELRDDQAKANAARASRPDLGTLTDEQLVERARSLVPLMRHLFCRHLDITAAASIGPGILSAIAAAMEDPTLSLTLISGVGDVDSALPSTALWNLSRLDADSDAFRTGFDAFVREFGSRGPNEWDIRSDTWETDPRLASSLIAVLRKAPVSDAPEIRADQKVAARLAAASAVRTALADQPDTLAQFEAGLRSAQLTLAGRERTKTNVIKVLHEARVAMRELAARHDCTASLLTMLLDSELDAFVADPQAFRVRLAAREQTYLDLYDLEPPFIIHRTVPPLGEWPRLGATHASAAASGDVLTGVPGCPGIATGRARVILDPADPTDLEPGDVLIAPITDPAWTPLFLSAAAVVVNVGAQVSHAVIVSRELGIPCVVSVADATERIPDGAMIEVDGSAGTVRLL